MISDYLAVRNSLKMNLDRNQYTFLHSINIYKNIIFFFFFLVKTPVLIT